KKILQIPNFFTPLKMSIPDYDDQRQYSERKQLLFNRTKDLFQQYSQFAIINLDNITSNQLQLAKKEWYGKAVFLFGKNTTIKKALSKIEIEKKEEIIEKIKGNVAFLFTNEKIKNIKQILIDNSRDANAKIGAIAQKDVFIDKQTTSMGPDKTSFFQAMGISTKITKGKVEIIQASHVLKIGERVSPSQANLLNIMDILPFSYSMKIENIYDQGFYPTWIIDISDEQVFEMMKNTISKVTALSIQTDTVTKTTVPIMARDATKRAFALSLALGLENKLTEK
ncbi:60S acidic ribosomal protein P0, partial [Pseudoloma neurophilia]